MQDGKRACMRGSVVPTSERSSPREVGAHVELGRSSGINQKKNVLGRKIIGKGLHLFREVEEVNDFWCILRIE